MKKIIVHFIDQDKNDQWRNDTDQMIKKVSKFQELICVNESSIKYFYFHNYLPTNIKDVTKLDWQVRNKIWSFKEGVASTQGIVINEIKELLQKTFSQQELSKILFICAPASTKEKNEKRFKDFSHKLCTQLGMENGFNKINIIKDREPSHLSSTTSNPLNYVNFEEPFFYKKRIIIFDDVVTRGRTICLISKKLKSMGAIPLIAISIGKTTHG